jgi:ribose 5-phosphate isomerase B
MKIAIASDHAGFELKEAVKGFLKEYEVIDFGTNSPDSMDYPDTGFAAAEAVAQGRFDRGILICGSGIGMSIVANKVDGIRAALVRTTEDARLSREHNNANILVLPGRMMTSDVAEKVIEVWFSTDFTGNRHDRRIKKIEDYENRRDK